MHKQEQEYLDEEEPIFRDSSPLSRAREQQEPSPDPDLDPDSNPVHCMLPGTADPGINVLGLNPAKIRSGSGSCLDDLTRDSAMDNSSCESQESDGLATTATAAATATRDCTPSSAAAATGTNGYATLPPADCAATSTRLHASAVAAAAAACADDSLGASVSARVDSKHASEEHVHQLHGKQSSRTATADTTVAPAAADSLATSPLLPKRTTIRDAPDDALPAVHPQASTRPESLAVRPQESLPPFEVLARGLDIAHHHSSHHHPQQQHHSPPPSHRHHHSHRGACLSSLASSSLSPYQPSYPASAHTSPVSFPALTLRSPSSTVSDGARYASPPHYSSPHTYYSDRRLSCTLDGASAALPRVPSLPSHSSSSDSQRTASTDGYSTSHSTPNEPPDLRPTLPPLQGTGSFRCDFDGCNAAPFFTQYLLSSHKNVHSQNRPHYCPVPDCPRGVAGLGFKRKNEMIRHGLVHSSPGYICPFCPDREHRYPRPDNLQRHVRVHHTDKDAQNPALREVLAQRHEGAVPKLRRRRAQSSVESTSNATATAQAAVAAAALPPST